MDREKVSKLVKRAKEGDIQAYGELYDLFVERIYAYIYYRVGREVEAEDLTADVFLRAFEAIKRFYPKRTGTFSAWLFKIAHNVIVDYFRRQSREAKIISKEGFKVSPMSEPENLMVVKLTQQVVQRALSQLTEEQQQVILLKFFAGFSNEEVALFLNKTEGAVKALQHRALESLSRILEGDK